MEYDFHVTHIKGASNTVCDSLSRLPVPPPGTLKAPSPKGIGNSRPSSEIVRDAAVNYTHVDYLPEEVLFSVSCLSQLPDPKTTTLSICKVIGTPATAAWDVLPLSIKDIAKATREDKVYGKLLSAVHSGTIDKKDSAMKPFISLFDNLHVEQGVVFHGIRCIVPTRLQHGLLDELHQTHPGMVKSKEVARNNFWWPGVNKQIEDIARACTGCSIYRKKPVPAPLCPWPYALRPMERVHIDFCEYKGKQLLIMIDAYSKYIWTEVMNTDTTTLKTLAVLYGWFCQRNGFPSTIVSDNGPQFTSHEFANKMAKWGIKHILTPPYHPASNGIAEKAVDIVKGKLKKMGSSSKPIDLYVNIQAALRVYRASPHSSTCQTPYELIDSAPVPVMFPRLQLSHQQIQENQRTSVPKKRLRKVRSFQTDDNVLVYDTQTKLNSKGVIVDSKSKNSYIVKVNGRNKHISSDHITFVSKDSSKEIVNVSDRISNSDRDSIMDSFMDTNMDSEYVNVSDSISDYNLDLTVEPNNSDLQYEKQYFLSDDESDISDSSYDTLPDFDIGQPQSFSSDNLVPNNVDIYVPRRKYKAEHLKLRDSLSTDFPTTRTRSGRL